MEIKMNYTRAELKGQSKELIRVSKPSVILTGAIYVVLGVVMAILSARITGARLTAGNLMQYYEHVENGNLDYAVRYFGTLMPTASERLMGMLLDMAYYIVTVGWYIFLLNTLRGLGATYGNLLDGFGFFWRIILLNIVIGVFVALWSLLLVIPGIIAAYRYRMAVYLLIDNPDMSVMDCIRESKAMMQGHKSELFVLDLSFLGWALLTAIPYVGYLIQIWTVPYMDMTYVIYYDRLRAQTASGSPYESNPGENWRGNPPTGY